MAEKIVLTIYILSHLIVAIFMMISDRYVGEAKGILYLIFNDFAILFFLVILIIVYFIAYKFYIKTKENKPKYSFMPKKIIVNNNKAHKFMLILILSHAIFTFITGAGKVNSETGSSLSFIFSFFQVESIFLFYYICCRERKKIYIFNIFLFFIHQLQLGWTGFIFTYFIIELFLYYKKNKNIINYQNIKLFFVSGGLILLGAKLYQYAFQFKNYVRYNNWDYFSLNYIEGLINLVNRFSFYPLYLSVFQNLDRIKILYNEEGIFLKEIAGMFRPLVPGFIMSEKLFRPLNNIFKQAIYIDITPITSANVGILSYLTALFYSDFFAGIIWVILTIILFILVSSVISSLENESINLDIIYFFMILNIVNVSALEQVFSNGFLKIFYIAPFLYLFGIIKNVKENKYA